MNPANLVALTTLRLHSATANSLVMNAFYLMASTFTVAATGFLFWTIVSNGHTSSTVGVATTLLSVSNLLSLLGMVGFDTAFVRFLPNTPAQNTYINSGLLMVTAATTLLSIISVAVLPLALNDLAELRTIGAGAAFIFFTVATALNTLTNAVFLAYKQGKYIFGITVLFSSLKVILPLMVANGGAMAIFMAAGVAQFVGLVASLIIMHRHTNFRFVPRFDFRIFGAIKKFSLSVYASSILNLLPITLLPLLIIHFLQPADAAYYYMAFTIASTLYTVAYATMQSAFAESSHNQTKMQLYIIKASQFAAALLIPASLITILSGNMLLGVFGAEYSSRAGTLLVVFALASLPVAAYSGIGAICKVTHNLRGVVSMNIAYALIILGSAVVLLPRLGLIAVGWSWLLGNIAACAIGAGFILAKRRRHT